MTLNRGVVVESPSARSAFRSWSARFGVLALLFTACMTPPTRMRGGSAGEDGEGGDGEGGSGGAGGGGSGGSVKLDAGPTAKLDASSGGGSGGGGSSGGAGGSGGGSGGSGGSPDAGAKLDGGKDSGPVSSTGTWEKLNLVLANCIFCHNDPSKRLDLQESGLYERLINAPATKAPAGCTNKTLVVPGQPMMSLLYLKIAGKMPAGCGERMPYKKAPVTAMELGIVFDWITAGAPKM
jgi:hypothetical protein